MTKKLSEASVQKFTKVLSKNRFRDTNSGVLKCLVDSDSHKMAQKFYHMYVSDTDFSKFPLFLQKLDNLLTNFGAIKAEKPTAEDDEDTRPVKPKNKGRNKG